MTDFDAAGRAALAVLADGPLPQDQLSDAVAARLNEGRPARRRLTREQVTRLVRMRSDVIEVDGEITLVPLLLDRTTWSVFVDPDDAAGTTGDGTRGDGEPHLVDGGWLRLRNQLDPLSWWLVENGAPLVDADGNEVGEVRTEGIWLDGADTDVLWSGPGWLDDVAGGWATVTVRDGTLSIDPLDRPPAATEAQVAAIRAGFDAAIADDESDGLWDEPPPDRRFTGPGSVVQQAVGLDGAAFRDGPVAPLADLFAAAGLVLDDALVAEEGFDWSAFRSWQASNRLVVAFDLDRAQAVLARAAIDNLRAALADDGRSEGRIEQLAEQLVDVDVTIAVFGEVLAHDNDIASTLDVLDRVATAATERGDRLPPGVVWGQATCTEALGDAVTADRLLHDAVAAGADDDLVLAQAAEFAADRGDAAAAWRMLRQAGVEPYDEDRDRHGEGPSPAQLLLSEVGHFAHPPRRREVGRNDPCPCGSGRKYKACHQRDTSFTLAERAPWLYEKAFRFARRSLAAEIDEIASVLADGAPDGIAALRDVPVVADLALTLDGGWEEFTQVRGPLLPDDEQMLAAQWAMHVPSVFEVVGVDRARRGGDVAGLRLRDLATGDQVRIENIQLGGPVQPGSMVFGRALPVGETYRAFSGFLPVSAARSNALIDAVAAGDVMELADLLAAEFRPAHLQNSDGEDFEMHEIEWLLELDRAALAGALGERGVEADPAESTWTLVGEAGQGPDTVIATLRVEDGPGGAVKVTADVNSAERAERVVEVVGSILPGVEPVRHHVTPFEEAMAAARERADDGAEPELLPPGAAEAIAEMMARHEERWIDEQLPALGGRTPREAVQDPIGREEVLRLLSTIPDPDGEDAGNGRGMDPTRLRSLLGLE